MEQAPRSEWRPTLEILLGHGHVRSDGERLEIQLRDAAFRYETLRTLGQPESLVRQLDVLSATAADARWLDLDAACTAWQRGRLGAGKLGLAAAVEVARRAGRGGPPIQSCLPDGFAPTQRVDLHDATGRRIAEVFSDGSRGFWRALDPAPALVRQLIELFARPRSRLCGGMETDGGMQADGLEELPPWERPTLEHLLLELTQLSDESGPIRSAVLTPHRR